MTPTCQSHTILTQPFHLVAVPTSCGKWPRFVCFVAWCSVFGTNHAIGVDSDIGLWRPES